LTETRGSTSALLGLLCKHRIMHEAASTQVRPHSFLGGSLR